MAALAIAALLQATVAFTTVATGADSQVSEPRQIVARSADEWQALWGAHGSERPPDIDFSRFTVVGVFLGTRMTAGYAVEIAAVRQQGKSVVVEYRERRPAPGALLAQVLTSPFHIVRIPRTDAPIEFRRLDTPP